jgi:hypothetical protein
VLRLVDPQTVYVIAGVFAAGATLVLLPLLRLRTHDGRTPGLEEEVVQPTVGERATV